MNATILLDTRTATRDEWLAGRKIGGSDAAAVCGLNPYCTPYQVFLEKVGIAPPREETEPMRWGHLLESVIAQEFSRRTGLEIVRDALLIAHPIHHFMTATLDYRVTEHGKTGPLQIKNRGYWTGKDYEDGLGDDAHVQIMHEMEVCGAEFGYVAALIGGNRLVWRRVERDEKLIARLIEIERTFWHLVETKTPPQMSAGDNEILAALHPTANGTNKVFGEEVGAIAASYLHAKHEAEQWAEIADAEAARLKLALGDAEEGCTSRHVIKWTNRTRTSIDTKALKAAHPTIAAEFVKTSPYREFKVREIDHGNE